MEKKLLNFLFVVIFALFLIFGLLSYMTDPLRSKFGLNIIWCNASDNKYFVSLCKGQIFSLKPLPKASQFFPDMNFESQSKLGKQKIKLNIKNKWCNRNLILKYSTNDAEKQKHQFEALTSYSGKPYRGIPAKFLNMSYMKLTNGIKQNKNLDLNETVTIVTAYFDLGYVHRAAADKPNRGVSVYSKWASIYAYVLNPLIVYTDSDEFATYIGSIRKKKKAKTTILRIERQDLWAFSLYRNVCSVLTQPGYPNFRPITERPDYICMVHAKPEVLLDAIRRNIYNTKFYSWLDAGMYRTIVDETMEFRVILPKDFDDTKVAIGKAEHHEYLLNFDPSRIMRGQDRWVAGGMFFGTRKVLISFFNLYKRSVEYFLSKNLANCEEQLLTAIYSKNGRAVLKPEVELQAYDGKPPLAFLCRKIIGKTLNVSKNNNSKV